MWLGYLRIVCITACLFVLAQEAAAQQQPVNSQPVYGQAVLPAPTIEPAMSREDQMAQTARNVAAQQRAASPGNTTPVTPLSPTPANGTAPTTAQQPVQNNQMLVPQNGQGTVQPVPQQIQPQIAMPSPAQVTTQPVTQAAPAATAAAETPAAATPAAPAKPAEVTNTAGFAPQAATAKLPLNSGMMPATNAGMDMSIHPDLVSGPNGYDPSLPPGPTNPVPYEVQLEQRTQELQQKARAQAFDQAKRSSLPMETYEIRDVLGRLKDTQEAIQTPVRPAPIPGNVIRTISTDPSAKPKTIHLAAGNVTTMNVVDISGAPWPIVDIGFGGAFDVKPPEPGGHVIRITPLKDFARGNLVIRLLKMTTPLTFTLLAGGKTVDYRFDARIPDYGPNAKMPLIDNGIQAVAGDKTTTSFLEGVPPTGAEKLQVDGIDARTSAYRFGGNLYVRTPLSLLSPSWHGSATSADGMNVYVLNDAPVLLLSDKGSLVRAKLTDNKKTTLGF